MGWRQNLFAVTAASFIGFTGFTLVMPFLPLYLQQLGVTDVGEIALWSGLCLGVTPAITALMSPLWGRVGDRFGRNREVVWSHEPRGACASRVIARSSMADLPALSGLTTLLGSDPIVAAATAGRARPIAVPEPARALFAATLATTTARRPV